jgi:hypothetical protein
MPAPPRIISNMNFLLLICCGLLLAAAARASESAAPPAEGPSAEKILREAFVNRYAVDLVSHIELVMRNRSGQERRRSLNAVSKVVDGRVHSIGRLLSPEYLRGMAVLMMEADDRSQDAFIFMPSLDKVRRITTAQRGDAFFGTDVTYEDVEQQRVDEFRLRGMKAVEYRGEAAYEIQAEPLRRYNYERALFTIAQSDAAILQVLYYKRKATDPYRVIESPREHMVSMGEHVLPTRLRVENRMRGTSTDVFFTDLRADVPIRTRLFSVRTLESQSPLPTADSFPDESSGSSPHAARP